MPRDVPVIFHVPSYSPCDYLELDIDSVGDQLVEGDEIVIQDGAS